MDVQFADLVVIAGSNFAENHPVGFRFVLKAKERGATVVHVDPRFTRTSAHADLYLPLRPGTDIAFTGGLINYVLQRQAFFRDYVLHYTNASFIVDKRFRDTEDLDGLFSGYNPATRSYDRSTWTYEFRRGEPRRDPTLRHPRCVLNVLRRHFSRYTPEMVESVCGTPKQKFIELCELLVKNSGRERTAVFAYAMGWTQHTIGVQCIRAAAALQLLLGNMGRPGGGILALRGHASIQGSTDLATLYDSLPGYIRAPSLERGETTFAAWRNNGTVPTGWWANWPKYAVSLMKAWYGEGARAENDWAFEYLPKNTGDHSHQPMFYAMKDGQVEGLVLWGQNPAAGGQNAGLQAAAMERLRWLVVRDFFETESAAFWKREGVDPRTIATEVFYVPAAGVAEKAGSFTNTMRLIQFHEKAVDPPNDARSDLQFVYELGTRLKALYAGSERTCDRPILDMTWDYESDDPRDMQGEPDPERVMREINGYVVESGAHVKSFADLRDDGSTACGAWIYSGMYPDPGKNLTRRRVADDWVSPEWAWSWPMNRRQLYNRASSDADGKPWSERKRLVWWDEERSRWTGFDVPDFPIGKAPSYRPDRGAGGIDAHPGDAPFIMQRFGVAEIFGVQGVADAPLPTHYEPKESPVANKLYPKVQNNPVLGEWRRPDNPYHETGDPRYPYVLTTYRLTEHHVTGAMTRWLPWLAELQPEPFVEVSPEFAVEAGIRHGNWVTIVTARAEVEARAMVTGRLAPLRIGHRLVHHLGLPMHFGAQGLVVGDSANELIANLTEPNVSIHEAKSFTCNVRLGRRSARTSEDRGHAAVSGDERTPDGVPLRAGVSSAAAAKQEPA